MSASVTIDMPTPGMSRRHQGTLQKADGKLSDAVKRAVTPGKLVARASSDDGGAGSTTDDFHELRNTVSTDSQQPTPSFEIETASNGGPLAVLENPTAKSGRNLVLLAACIYGSNFSVVKLLDDTMPVSISASLRFALAASAVAAIVLGREAKDVDAIVAKERKLAMWSGVEIGLWYCIGYMAQAEGLQTVEAGKSAFFNALAVVVVPILDVVFKGKILERQEIMAVLIACVGVGLLELGPAGGLEITSGDTLAFMQTIFFGVGYWRLESESHAHMHQAARLTVGQLSSIAIGSVLYAFSEFGFDHLSLDLLVELGGWLVDPFIIGALIWTGLVATALALYLETVALKVISATELTLLMTTTSLWGAAFAFATLGEVLSPTGMVGGMLIMAGCVLGNVSSPSGKISDNSVHSIPRKESLEHAESV